MRYSIGSTAVRALTCLTVLGLLAFGCATVAEHPSAWVGRDVSRLEAAWGPPDWVDERPDGTTQYMWSRGGTPGTPEHYATHPRGYPHDAGYGAAGSPQSSGQYIPPRPRGSTDAQVAIVDAKGTIIEILFWPVQYGGP